MKRFLLLALCLSLSLPAAFAAKGDKKAGKGQRKATNALISGADKNGNLRLDDDEVTALRDEFAKGGEDAKSLDQNANGKLDDEEISSINARLNAHGKKKSGQAKAKDKGKKKQQA
jgi:hypothetical protein